MSECVCGETSARNCPVHQLDAYSELDDANIKYYEENKRLKETIRYWENKKIDIAQCCLENELEAKKFKKKCEVMKKALEQISTYGLSQPSPPARDAINALAEAEAVE